MNISLNTSLFKNRWLKTQVSHIQNHNLKPEFTDFYFHKNIQIFYLKVQDSNQKSIHLSDPLLELHQTLAKT